MAYSSAHPGASAQRVRVISVDAGPDDTGSIVPPDSACSGGLCNKWVSGGTLHAQATLRFSLGSEAGSPFGKSTYSRLKLLQLARGFPDVALLSLLARRAAPALWTPTPCGGTAVFRVRWRAWAITWLVRTGQCRWDAHASDSGYGGMVGPGTRYSFGYFPPTPRLPLSGLTAPSAPRDAGKKDD